MQCVASGVGAFMHELGIAVEILKIVLPHAEMHKAKRVTALKVRVGVHRGIIAENLRYLFLHAAKGSLAENAILEIEEEPVRIHCATCGTNESRSFVIKCPVCNGESVQVDGGDSLSVVSLEIDE